MTSKLENIFKETDGDSPISTKEREIYKNRINNQYQDLEERKEIRSLISNINIGLDNKNRSDRIISENNRYFTSLKKITSFVNDDFKPIIGLYPGTLTLCIAHTGSGKSTLSANLAFHTMKQGKNVLMVVNEEKANDCYNRVASISQGIHYQSHDEFSDEQRERFNKYVPVLSKKMTVIDNYSDDGTKITRATTSVEGMEHILREASRMQADGDGYDVIIIDYYQNVCESIANPSIETWQAQERFGKILDKYKNVLCPIILLAQKKPGKEENEGDYKNLIEGRKSIANVATAVLSIVADKENQRTEWICKKNRWSSAIGKSVFTGYHNGKYVRYTDDFRYKIEKKKTEIMVGETIKKKIQEIGKGG